MDIVELLSLGLLGGTFNHEARVEGLKKYLHDYFDLNIAEVNFRSPNLFNRYLHYISLPIESCTYYFELKQLLTEILGKVIVADMMNHTYFLYRTVSLEKKLLTDKVSIEVLPY